MQSDADRDIDRRRFLERAAAGGVALAVFGSGTALAGAALRRGSPGSLAGAIRGEVIERGQRGFGAAAHVYNRRFDSTLPQAVARPLDAEDVRDAVAWLVAHGVPLRARSGGHSYAGYSTLSGGVVLDLRRLSRVRLDRRAGVATIGAGAQLIDVYAALARAGVTIPAGSCPSVGIGGHALGGGMGLAGRAFGLTTDSLIGATIATADGRLRNVDQRSDSELLWALRGGGGGNFGVVTSLRLRVHRIPRASSWFMVSWPWSSAGDALDAWLRWAPRADQRVSSVFHLQTGPGVLTAGQYMGPARDLSRLLAPLQGVAGAALRTGDQDYMGLQVRWANCLGRTLTSCHTDGTRPGGALGRMSFDAKSDFITRPLSAAGRDVLISAIERRQGRPGSAAILFDSYGGAINRVAPNATAFIHRNAAACIQYLSYNGGTSWLAQTHAAMRRHVSGMAYQNYIDPALTGWRRAYYGSNYPTLVQVQQRVDPDHFFNFPQAIGR